MEKARREISRVIEMPYILRFWYIGVNIYKNSLKNTLKNIHFL